MSNNLRSLRYRYKTPEELFQCYMQFLMNEGVFIPVSESFKMHESVDVSITLPSEEVFEFTTQVVWVTPKEAMGFHSTPGVGVEFPLKMSHALSAAILIVLGNFDRYAHLHSYTLRPE